MDNPIQRQLAFRAFLGIILFLFFVYIFKLNQFTPLWADDYQGYRVYASFWDFLIMIKKIYFEWTGRYTLIFISCLLFMKGSLIYALFNFLNALIFVLLVYGIFLNSQLRRPCYFYDIPVLILIFILLWVFLPAFAEVTLWKSGAITYLWPVTATMYFIYPFVKLSYGDYIFKDTLTARIGMSIAGLIVGGWMEYVAAALSVILLGFLGYQYYKKQLLPKWSLLAAISYWLGTFILIIAPGNYIRMEVVNYHAPLTYKIIENSKLIYSHFVHGGLFKVALAIGLLTLILNYWSGIKNIFVRHVTFFFILALLSAYALIGGPMGFYGRVTLASDVFFITALVGFLSIINNKYKNLIYGVASLILLICTLPSFINIYKELENINEQTNSRVKLIQFYQQKNIKDAFISPYFYSPNKSNYDYKGEVMTQYVFMADIASPPTPVNGLFSNYYGFKTALLMPSVVLPWSAINFKINNGLDKNKFQIFLQNGYLYYIKRGASCEKISNKGDFFLRVFPKNKKTLATQLQDTGYLSLDWAWDVKNIVIAISDEGKIYSDRCIFRKKLPAYEIESIVTGQYVGSRIDWKKNITLSTDKVSVPIR